MTDVAKLVSGEIGPASRSDILDLQMSMAELPNQVDGEELVVHHFAPSVYGREIYMRRGLIVVGKIHKHAHLNVLLSGKVRVVTEFGNEELVGPCVWISEPGTKRAVYILENTRWLTVHPNETNTTDLGELEDYVIAPDYQAYETFLLENK